MTARVLIIEDNPANLELMRYLLDAFRHEPLMARHGLEGVELARTRSPDLVLCDVQLPDIDGYEVVARIRRQSAAKRVPVVAVTALAMVGDRDRVLAAGFDGYLAKPIDPETFVQQVEAFLPPAARQARRAPAEASSIAPAAIGPKTGTILAVDNLQVNLDLTASLFTTLGYRVVTAQRAREAIELAHVHALDVVVSDVCMPEGDGYDLIRAFKSDPRLRRIPFVFLTSTMTNEEDRSKGLALGAARFLFRPIEPQALLAEVERCLAEVPGP